jgi:hypothetical protein
MCSANCSIFARRNSRQGSRSGEIRNTARTSAGNSLLRSGNEVSLKPGAQVDVTIEADADATKPKNEPDEKRKK